MKDAKDKKTGDLLKSSGARRQAAYAERQRAAGRRQINFWLTEDEAAQLADHVWIMDAGRIAIDGTVAELTATESLEDVFLRHTGAQA